MEMEKRKVAEMNEVRGAFYAEVENVAVEGYTPVGMTAEGFVFVDAEGKAVVVKVVAKALGFNANDAVADHKEKEIEKAAKEVEKAEKAAEKAAKAAERAKAKAEKDAAKDAK